MVDDCRSRPLFDGISLVFDVLGADEPRIAEFPLEGDGFDRARRHAAIYIESSDVLQITMEIWRRGELSARSVAVNRAFAPTMPEHCASFDDWCILAWWSGGPE